MHCSLFTIPLLRFQVPILSVVLGSLILGFLAVLYFVCAVVYYFAPLLRLLIVLRTCYNGSQLLLLREPQKDTFQILFIFQKIKCCICSRYVLLSMGSSFCLRKNKETQFIIKRSSELQVKQLHK